jgi:hypothetical protein
MEFDGNTEENIGEIQIYKHTSYWIYRIEENFWDQLVNNFNRKKFYLSSFKTNLVKKDDVVLIFKTNKSPQKTGFVCICQISSDIQHNTDNIKIFGDKNMNKFYSELNSVFLLDDHIKLSDLKDKIVGLKYQTFRRTNIGDNTMFVKLQSHLAIDIIHELTANIDECTEDLSDEILDNTNEEYEEEENDDESVASHMSDGSNDVEVRMGHIPILFEPCNNFNWDNDMNVRIKNFKNHFSQCSKCQQTDNNEVTVISKFDKSQFYCADIKDENAINKYLEYYQNLKRWKIELIDDDKKYDHVIIYRVNDRSNLYHGCCIVLW